jgi:hypothetical protein
MTMIRGRNGRDDGFTAGEVAAIAWDNWRRVPAATCKD